MRIRQVLCFAVFAFLIVCVFSLGAQPIVAQTTEVTPDVTFPDLTGPYKVGRTSLEWIDQSRDETFASVPGLKRDLMVYIWYPTTTTRRGIAPYMESGGLWTSLDGLMWGLWSGHPGLESKVHNHAYGAHAYDAVIIDTDQPSYPVVIFDPGHSGISLNYASIIEDLVSHGYIVIGMSHPYNTSFILYPDGRMVVSGASAENTNDSDSTLKIWTQDVRFALDQAEQLNTTNKKFEGHLDLTHIGMFGHSYGGGNAVEVTAVDPRVLAGVSLDGATATDLGSKPFLFIGQAPATIGQDQDKYTLVIDGAAHLNYGDFGLLRPLIPEMSNLGTIDPARGVQIINSYLLAFFDHTLKGADLTWPSDEEAHLTAYDSSAAATPAS